MDIEATLEAVLNQVVSLTATVSSLTGGDDYSEVPRTILNWQTPASRDLSQLFLLSPFGVKDGVPYFAPQGANALEAAWPYVAPSGRVELRVVRPNAAPEPPVALASEVATKAEAAEVEALRAQVEALQRQVEELQRQLDLKAPIDSPDFTGTLTTPALRVYGGSPMMGEVLTSDYNGNASWTPPAVISVAGKAGKVVLMASDIGGLSK